MKKNKGKRVYRCVVWLYHTDVYYEAKSMEDARDKAHTDMMYHGEGILITGNRVARKSVPAHCEVLK